MSAYGAISGPTRTSVLPSTIWQLRPNRTQHADTGAVAETNHLTLHHLTLASASALPGLVPFLHAVFADELARGRTYPQELLPGETYSRAQFEAYYFAQDVLLAIFGRTGAAGAVQDGQAVEHGIEAARAGRSWAECIAGCYYVKPNYPGRSSHICNAGFLVPPAQRARGAGTALARSFLHYAPRLGYAASVFNLVYVNNLASVRLWESLGFEKAGRIPRAGRLRTADGSDEEFVDAWVFYRTFEAA